VSKDCAKGNGELQIAKNHILIGISWQTSA